MIAEQDKTDIIRKNLEVGKLAKAKMYNSLLQRINSGEVLHGKELETYEKLDAELRKEYEPGVHQSYNNSSPTPEYLDNALAVTAYLKSKGYKVEKSTIYNHKSAGKIRPNKDGLFLVADVEKYALAHLKFADGSPSPAQVLDKAQKIKSDAETREKLARARNWELRTAALEQKLVPRELFDKELAARAAIFRTDGETFFLSQAAAIINIVAGDATKTSDLIEYCLAQFEKWLARYLQKESFDVDVAAYEKIFEQAGKDESDDEEMLLDEET